MHYLQYTNRDLYDLPEKTRVYLHMPDMSCAGADATCVATFEIDGNYLVSVDQPSEIVIAMNSDRCKMTGIFGIFACRDHVIHAHQAYLATPSERDAARY